MLNEKQRAFLAEPRFGSLATIGAQGMPHQTVMWYALDGDEIMFNTTREREKTKHLARDERVSLLVFDGYRYVRVTGRAREAATGDPALEDIVSLGVRYGGTRERAMNNFRGQDRVSYRFLIERVYSSADLR